MAERLRGMLGFFDLPPEAHARFRDWRRRRMRPARAILFLVIALGFALAPLHNQSVFQASEALRPLLLLVELGLMVPLLLAAALLTLLDRGRLLTQALQSVAATAAVAVTLALRYLALDGQMNYPAQMSGIVLIALAMFGGFNWNRIALLSLGYLVLSLQLEFTMSPGSDGPWLEAYACLYTALIAFTGSLTHEYLLRRTWTELNRVREARAALQASEQRFNAFMDNSPFIAWIKDEQQHYIYRNQGHRDRYGSPGEDWTGQRDADHFPAVLADVYRDTDRQVLERRMSVQFETRNSSRDGEHNHWLVQKFPVVDGTGRISVGGIGMDITPLKQLQEQLRESQARFNAFMDNHPSVAWMKDEDGRYVFVNRALREFLGVRDDSWHGKTDKDYFSAEFAQKSRELDLETLRTGCPTLVEGEARDSTGAMRHWLLTRFGFLDARGRKFVGGVATDLTDRKRAEDLIRMQALTDELTGLYNRRGFALLAEQEIRKAQRQRQRCALMYVDLDWLKKINQDHGHAGGDLAISTVGEALRVAVRRSDIVARIGGDEFVVLVAGCDDLAALRHKIADEISSYSETKAVPFPLSATIGVWEFDPRDGHTLDEQMLRADQAMFAAKHARDAEGRRA